MELNERQISMFLESKDGRTINNYEKILKDYNFLNEAYREYNNNNPITNGSNLLKLDCLNNYIALTMSTNPRNLNASDMIKYRDYLYNLCMTNPLIITDCILFKKEYAGLLFTQEQLNNINMYKNNILSRIKLIKQKLDNNVSISEEENRLYYHYCANTSTDNVFLEQEIARIINKKDLNFQEQEFILKYFSKQICDEKGIPPVDIYISDNEYDGSNFADGNKAYNLGNCGVVFFNKKYIKSKYIYEQDSVDYIYSLIKTLAHEVNHSVQSYNSISTIDLKGYYSVKSNLFRKYLSSNDFDEYSANYKYNEIERDSNIYGWQYATRIMSKYCPEKTEQIKASINNEIITQYGLSLATKTNKNKNRKPMEVYNVQNLDDIVSKYPKVVNDYPSLKVLYNVDGTKKTINEMLDIEQKNPKLKDLSKIYREHYLAYIFNGTLEKLNVEQLPLENQFALFEKIFNILMEEIKSMERTISVLYEKNTMPFEYMGRVRKNRITKLLEYINNNMSLINNLVNIDKNQGNQRSFAGTLNFVKIQYDSFQRKINKTSKLENTQLYDELNELSEVEFNGYKR